MFLKRTLTLLFVFVVFTELASAQYLTGSGRLHHVTTSALKRTGNYDAAIISGNSLLFGQQTANSGSVNFMTQNYALIDLSITDNVQLTTGFELLQSVVTPSKTKITAGPVFLTMKVGNLTLYDNTLDLGLMVSGSVSLSGEKNVAFYPYNSGSFETGMFLYGSYFLDGKLRNQSESYHANIGIQSHGDKDLEYRKDSLSYSEAAKTMGIKYALGYKMPKGKWTYGVETWGEMFFRNPPGLVYSRESYLYVTGVARYNMNWVELEGAFDLLLLGYGDKTDYTTGVIYGYDKILKDGFNYNPYMITIGANFNLSTVVGNWLGETPPTYYYDTTVPDEYTEALRKEDILTLIENKYYADLYECYRGARRFDESIKGTIYFDFTIKEDGTIEKAKAIISTFDSQYTEQLEQCMVEKIMLWTFPQGKNPVRFEILPLNFGGGRL